MLGPIALLITGLITGGIVLSIALRIDDWKRDFSQNEAELSENATREQLKPLEFSSDSETVATALREWVQSESKWQWVSSEDTESDTESGDGNRTIEIKLTRTTPLFRFTDDITVTIQSTTNGPSGGPSGGRLTAHSKSRLGKGDLGQNPRNLIELKSGVAKKLMLVSRL